ncbi:FUSC family protein [Streptomyces griseoluteus]|uniref:FUSC family protein n=1 Tax=Streptomyces griseoluteus TaxID=29306 RepID=A0A4Z1DFY0_STRGP|nr:FUSC family protein [Streptomyces griseoluteus]TGN82333.1 FUSC family protein [Streptomyces griseoluteus]GHF10279.1 FUSC family protein [Streptomyces griseoluteus]
MTRGGRDGGRIGRAPGGALTWLRGRDPGLAALRRALRAAILTPSVLAVTYFSLGRPDIAVFAAFGSLVLTLFVDFGGPMRERIAGQAALILATAVMTCLGTLAGQTLWLTGAVTFVLAFCVLFSGIVSSALAGATTSLLFAYILPVTLGGPLDEIPEHVIGWALGGVASMIAVTLMWPVPASEPLRAAGARACALLAGRLRAEVDCAPDPTAHGQALETAVRQAEEGVSDLRKTFYGTPYRPTGLSLSSRAVVRLVDQVIWLGSVLHQAPPRSRDPLSELLVCETKMATADLLEHSAALLRADVSVPHGIDPRVSRLEQARASLEESMIGLLPRRSAVPVARADRGSVPAAAPGPSDALIGCLGPSFRAQSMSFVVNAIGGNIQLAVTARQRSRRDRLLGRRPPGSDSALSSARERFAAHLSRNSVWLHNSLRGAAALSLAVVIAHLTGLGHAFWVASGTLAVLRSNAVGTGQTVQRALLGTVLGFVVGVPLILALGAHPVLLWLLLPLAILLVGMEAAVTAFTAGQAGFTVVLLVLFSIIHPEGWQLGLVRIEDVALGCAVSLVVGLLLWPLGAAAALGRVLCDALGDGARYLRSAVVTGLALCDRAGAAGSASGDDDRRRALASARRLDDAFREYLAERGTKHLPLADVTALVDAVAILRLTADAVTDLWSRAEHAPENGRAAAGHEILDSCVSVTSWFESAGRALAGGGAAPGRPLSRPVVDAALRESVSRDLRAGTEQGTATAVRMVWMADHLDTMRRLQAEIDGPVGAAAASTRRQRARGRRLRAGVTWPRPPAARAGARPGSPPRG